MSETGIVTIQHSDFLPYKALKFM